MKPFENIVGKGENASNQNGVLTHFHTMPTLTSLEKKVLENIVGKGENTGNQHFLLFAQCFLLFPAKISIFESLLFCRLQMH